MLDDLKYIHQKDSLDTLGQARRHIEQLTEGITTQTAPGSYTNLVFYGTGTNTIAASLAKEWPGIRIPYEITETPEMPSYTSPQTLFITVASDMTLPVAKQAKALGAHVVVIGAVEQLARLADDDYETLPLGRVDQPFTTFRLWKGLAKLAESYGVAKQTISPKQFEQLHASITMAADLWQPTVPTNKNLAKQIAQELIGRSIIIHSGPLLYPAARSWKSAINQQAQTVAWTSRFPDFMADDLLGWTSHPMEKPYASVFLRSSFDTKLVLQAFATSERVLSGRWPTPEQITVMGNSPAEQLAWCLALGDFVSIYIALLNGKNPLKESQLMLEQITNL